MRISDTTLVGGLTASIIAALFNLNISVQDARDGINFKTRDFAENPVWIVLHSTETYGAGHSFIREIHRDRFGEERDVGYFSTTDYLGGVVVWNEIEEVSWNVAGQNTKVIGLAALGSGHKKAWTFRHVKTLRSQINVVAKKVTESGGEIMGVVVHGHIAKKNPTACAGDIANKQAEVDGIISHIKDDNGCLIVNPNFEEGIHKGKFIYRYLYETGKMVDECYW